MGRISLARPGGASGLKTASTRKAKPQTSNLFVTLYVAVPCFTTCLLALPLWRFRRVHSPCRLRKAAVRMAVCAPRSDAQHTQHSIPSAHTGHRTPHTQHTAQHTGQAHRGTRAKKPRKSRTQRNAPSEHNGEQESSGAGRRTRNTTHPAATPVNRSQLVQDTAHKTQCAKRA